MTTEPGGATALQAVAHALKAVGREAFTPARREFSARRRAVIAAHRELQEREALKGLALTASMADALERPGTPGLTAYVAAQLGALALKIAYERWSDMTDGNEFVDVQLDLLSVVAESSSSCPVSCPRARTSRTVPVPPQAGGGTGTRGGATTAIGWSA